MQFRKFLIAGLTLAVGTSTALTTAQAANKAWSTAPGSGLFSGTNWTPGQVPSSPTTSVASGDSLYFGTSSITSLTDNLTGYTFAGFTFLSGASAFTIGGNAFTLSGAITNNSTSTETINNNITLAATEAINANLGNVNLGGAIGDGGGGFGLTKNGTGTLTLSGASTYTGTTTVNAGTLNLTGSLASTTLALGGGTFNYAPTAAGATQSFSTTNVAIGGTTTTVAAGSTLALGTINRTTAGTVLFDQSNGTTTGTATATNGILPWGVVLTNVAAAAANSANGYTFATGTLGAYTAATAASTTASAWGGIPSGGTGTVNYDLTINGTPGLTGLNRNVNSIRYTGSGLIQNGNTNTILLNANAILNAGTGVLQIGASGTAFSVAPSTTNELVLTAASAGIIIGPVAIIADNGGTAGTVTIAGPNVVTLSGISTYTGGTNVNGGTLALNAGGSTGAIRGTLNINPGANVQLNVADALGYGNITTPALAVTQVNINGGTLNDNGNFNNGYFASYTLTGGSVTSTGGGSINMLGTTTTAGAAVTGGTSITSLASATTSTISAPLVIRSVTGASATGTNLTINVARGTAPTDLLISGQIRPRPTGEAGLNGITKTGTGILELTAANTYTGATTISAGTLLLSTGSINASPTVSVASGGVLTLGNAAALNDAGALSLVSGSALNLNDPNASSTSTETIGSLSLNGVLEPAGTYTAAQLTAFDNTITFLALNGETLTVAAVPEPGTVCGTFLLAGAFGWMVLRRKRGASAA